MNKGKFIVIDGTDGSGKGTQTKLLIERLKKEGYDVMMADFPQYGQKSAGPVEEYLNGKYGSASDVTAKQASILYAVDRFDFSFKLKKWIDDGKIVITNRYVSANMGHQGGKIKDDEERKKFFEWLYELEYEIFNIPRPDLNIILHVRSDIAQKLVDKKGHRDYVGGKKRDIHEDDLDHLKNAEKVYLQIANDFEGFTLIECTKDDDIMSIENIHEMLWKYVDNILKNG